MIALIYNFPRQKEMPPLNKREITKIGAYEDQKGRLSIRLPNALSSHLSARPVRPADALLTVEKGCSASHGFVDRANLPDAGRYRAMARE